MLYIPRRRFAEFAYLSEEIEVHIPHAVISNVDLRAGRLLQALEAVLEPISVGCGAWLCDLCLRRLKPGARP